ncbi:hypothetical protein ACH5RR_035338 [Cinchona calisaya]|uniref:non-specific serine/threonine protein kinase n=1 Tax=Cinchona calisaya TaxID=153742 RepID=A0ABD2YDL0_9GENT
MVLSFTLYFIQQLLAINLKSDIIPSLMFSLNHCHPHTQQVSVISASNNWCTSFAHMQLITPCLSLVTVPNPVLLSSLLVAASVFTRKLESVRGFQLQFNCLDSTSSTKSAPSFIETLLNSSYLCKGNTDEEVVGDVHSPPTPSSSTIIMSTNTSSCPNLKMFSYGELESATRNFRADTVLGEGGFGRVFKGWVDQNTFAPSSSSNKIRGAGLIIPVAVKKSNPDGEQGFNEWLAEVEFLGKFCHPNLVKLLGYCWEDEQFLLVYEYMRRGSLESHLFRKGAETLSWETRLKIAIGAARGLAFLHTAEKQVIYRDFKAANVLLDSDFNAKLSDFGLAKLGPVNGNSHVTTRVAGTYGYAAPEYVATGHLYVKSDVYGFGVVLLEIISGRRVIDFNRPSGEQNLVDWAKPLLPENRKLKKIMDPQLDGRYPSAAPIKISDLILQCLEPDPKKRPSMEQVLETLQKISNIKMKSKDVKAQNKVVDTQKPTNRRHHNHHRSPRYTHQKFSR